MNDQELDDVLAVLRSDDGSHLGSVSGRVMGQIEADGRRRVAVWGTLAAAAALMAVGLFLIPLRPEARMAVETPVVPQAPEFAYVSPPPHAAVPAIRRRPVLATVASRRAGPLEVRMQTDDPDVLIIWLVDGDEERGNQ